MKNLFAVLGIVLLSALYCSTIRPYKSFSQNTDFINKSDSVKGKNYSTVSIELFTDSLLVENYANPSNNFPPSTLKNSFAEFLAIVKITEQFFANVFVQYISISKNFRIKYRKANIIFPFHYFW